MCVPPWVFLLSIFIYDFGQDVWFYDPIKNKLGVFSSQLTTSTSTSTCNRWINIKML